MDFTKEEDKLFDDIVAVTKEMKRVKSKDEEDELAKRNVVSAGTCMWLISNPVHSMTEFRSKLDSLSNILSHPQYLEMEGNLYISSVINGYLAGYKSREAYDEMMGILGLDGNISRGELDRMSRVNYNAARIAFNQLRENEEIKKDAKNCNFAFNFKFTGDYKESESLHLTVSSFCDISDKLEEIYRKKSLEDHLEIAKPVYGVIRPNNK